MQGTYAEPAGLRRLTVSLLVIALGFIPVLLAVVVYGAMGVIAAVVGAIGGTVDLVYAGVSKLTKRLAPGGS